MLLAPALPWLMAPGALAGVHVPVFARSGERDELAQPAFIEHVLAGVPAARLDYAAVPGAGHFAFWGPVPAALAGPQFPPGNDPPGFDRAAYQATPLTPVGPNTWLARVTAPAQGWTAVFVELTFDVAGRPLKLTTSVRVLPDRLPFEAPVARRVAGQR